MDEVGCAGNVSALSHRILNLQDHGTLNMPYQVRISEKQRAMIAHALDFCLCNDIQYTSGLDAEDTEGLEYIETMMDDLPEMSAEFNETTLHDFTT
jgi:hypothetical protein